MTSATVPHLQPVHALPSLRDTSPGLTVARRFTRAGVDPADELEWELREASIAGEDGKPVFHQADVEVPKRWSPLATNVVASKYFRGTLGTPARESSVRALVARVVDTITAYGREGGYFASPADAAAFRAELAHLVLHQRAAFNSPVWFNVGVEPAPQCGACFINSVEDTMESILGLAKTEGMLFKYGSGTGSNLSPIRSSKEGLKGGGVASGPVSFMKGFDAFAGVIKSGGKTRRAAKMVILDATHPDILDFVRCKAAEEAKAHALIEAGYDGSFGGEAYASVFFQNSNNSVRVTDDFMRAVESGRTYSTRAVVGGALVETLSARAVFREVAQAAWGCGDPGLQFDTTINGWHTCPASGRINASNPCSEYMFLDDTACNLASLNLLAFRDDAGSFDIAAFVHAVDVVLLAQEILVGASSYPTPAIARNSRDFRPLGLGYANLGALLMAQGLAYDSPHGRALAAAITSLMTARAFAQSARMAQQLGPFAGYVGNAPAMLRVVRRHRDAALQLAPSPAVGAELHEAQQRAWDEALALGEAHGFRNAQVSVLAPTGTIGFMMDCDTTGIEPDIALVKYKALVGGGRLKLVNQTVPAALSRLGYDAAAVADIAAWLEAQDTIEDAPHLLPQDLAVFDCAFRAAKGTRSISAHGHLAMMAAVQPFLSGAISKTVNLPHEASVEDIEGVYLEAWRLGLKAVAVYRDGCKRSQPLTTAKVQTPAMGPFAAPAEEQLAVNSPRRRLPDERRALTHKFSIAGHEGYVTVGLYEDGKPGELFITMAKEGSTVSGLMDAFATAVSLALQYGVPLKVLVEKFSHTRFEPSGFTGHAELPIAKSITDYLFRWLALRFLPAEAAPSEEPSELELAIAAATDARPESTFRNQEDAPPCASCGAITVRSGACYRCHNCGATTGCG